MSRKVFVLLTLVLIGGIVVAFVRGQDSSRRRVTVSAAPSSTPSHTSSQATPSQTTLPSRPRPPQRGTVVHFGDDRPQSASQPQGSASQAPATRGGSLADRLKSIRRSGSHSGSATAPPASVAAPAPSAIQSVSPAAPRSVVQQAPVVAPPSPFRIRSVPNGADPPAARTALRSVLQHSDVADDAVADNAVVDNGGPAPPALENNDPPLAGDSTLRRSIHSAVEPFVPSAPLRDDRGSSGASISSSRSPAIQIDTVGPPAISIGKEATYTVTVSNLGDSAANGLSLAVGVPDWVELAGNQTSRGTARRAADTAGQLVWNIDVLPGRSHEQLTVRLVPQSNRPFEISVDWTFVPESSSTRVEVQQPQLELSITGADEVLYGETTVYTIVIANPGTGDAEGVVLHLAPLSAQQQSSQTSQIGTIAAGGQKQFRLEFHAREAGEAEIRASAEGDGGLQAEAVASIRVRRAELQVDAGGPKLKFAGSVASYQVRVVNHGDATADDVVLAAALPGGAKFISGSDGAEATEGGVIWSLGQLTPGAQRSFEIRCELHSAGDNRLEIGVQGAGDLAARDMVVTRVESIADLSLTVISPEGPKPVGEDVVYEIHIVNRGTESARRVNVVTQFSDGIEPAAAEGARAEIVPGQILFDPIERIGPGEELTLRVSAQADKSGNHVFRVEVKCADPETRLASEGTTRFFNDESAAPRTAQAPRPLQINPAPAQQIDAR